MKSKLIILLSFLAQLAISQEIGKSTSFSWGIMPDGGGAAFNYQLYPKSVHKDFYEFGLLVACTYDEKNRIPVDNVCFKLGYNTKISFISTSDKAIATYLGLGGQIGYEEINHNQYLFKEDTEILNKSGTVYGFYVALENDIALTHFMSLTTQATYYNQINSSVGNDRLMVSLGIKLFFNQKS